MQKNLIQDFDRAPDESEALAIVHHLWAVGAGKGLQAMWDELQKIQQELEMRDWQI